MRPGPKGHGKGPLTRWREARDLTQRALAEALRYTPSAISKLEANGDIPSPRFREWLRREFPGADTEKLCARWERS